MNKNIEKTVFLALILFVCSLTYGQTIKSDGGRSGANDPAVDRAEEIISAARKAVGFKMNSAQLRAFSISYEQIREAQGLEIIQKIETRGIMPDRIQQVISSRTANAAYPQTSSSTQNFDGQNYENRFESFKQGKPIRSVYENTLRPSDASKKDSKVKQLKFNAFLVTLPLTYDFAMISPSDFRYRGVAESPDGGKADVIKLVSSDKEVYQLFFDQKTHLLLMLTKEWVENTNENVTYTYYFSDYKKTAGYLYPHRLMNQKKGDTFIEDEALDNINIDFNPVFKNDLFDVRGKS